MPAYRSPAMRLMDHKAGIGQGASMSVRAAGHQQRAHGRRHAHADRVHGSADILCRGEYYNWGGGVIFASYLHSVVDGQAVGDGSAGRVDVHADGALGVL